MATEHNVTIALTAREIQWLEQAVLDDDARSALELLRDVIKPRVDAVINRPHCKPAFEWGTDVDFRPSGPPRKLSR